MINLVLKAISKSVDVATLPFYYFTRNSSQVNKGIEGHKMEQKAIQIDPKDPLSAWIRSKPIPKTIIDDCSTLDTMMDVVINNFRDKPCLGYRRILSKSSDGSKSPDGKLIVKKLMEPEYNWITYGDFDQQINHAMAGLQQLTESRSEFIMILMETRFEWMICCQSIFRMGSIVSTLFTSLSAESLIRTMNQIKSRILITSNEFLPTIQKIIFKLTSLQYIIVVCDEVNGQYEDICIGIEKGIKVIPFHQMVKTGSQIKRPLVLPSDKAVLMFTSGSTGEPKGILLSHENVVHGIKGISSLGSEVAELTPGVSKYIGYLPLAHIMELLSEPCMLSLGIGIGYSSPYTLLSISPGLAPGCPSDLDVLKPDAMAAVPLILDKVRKVIEEKVNSKGSLFKSLFNYLIDYRDEWCFRKSLNYGTPILDFLIFKKLRFLGPNLKLLIVGGAPVSAKTQIFTRNCLGIPVFQAYATSESCGAGCSTDYFDRGSCGTVGSPSPGTKIRLEEWSDANYTPFDTPNPRGEILICSKSVSAFGYFNDDQLTRETFFDDKNGDTWLRTGDIGEVLPDGSIRIIDRKKDIIKLQNGEFVSLGKVGTSFMLSFNNPL